MIAVQKLQQLCILCFTCACSTSLRKERAQRTRPLSSSRPGPEPGLKGDVSTPRIFAPLVRRLIYWSPPHPSQVLRSSSTPSRLKATAASPRPWLDPGISSSLRLPIEGRQSQVSGESMRHLLSRKQLWRKTRSEQPPCTCPLTCSSPLWICRRHRRLCAE